MAKLTEKSAAVFNWLREHDGEDHTAKDIAAAMGLEARSINGVVTGLQKRGLTVRVETEVVVVDDEGNESPDKVKFVALTDAGREYDPEADE